MICPHNDKRTLFIVWIQKKFSKNPPPTPHSAPAPTPLP